MLHFLKLVLFAGLGMLATQASCAAQPNPDDVLQVQLAIRSNVRPNQPLLVQLLIRNTAKSACVLPQDMLPEGWLIKLRIHDRGGAQVYASAAAKVELTASKLQQLVTLQPQGTYAVDLAVPAKLSPGEYVLDATFSTEALAGRHIAGVPVGTWNAASLKFTVLPER